MDRRAAAGALDGLGRRSEPAAAKLKPGRSPRMSESGTWRGGRLPDGPCPPRHVASPRAAYSTRHMRGVSAAPRLRSWRMTALPWRCFRGSGFLATVFFLHQRLTEAALSARFAANRRCSGGQTL
jgi:hypothetical protein